jgi:hypothetical protein
MASSSLPAAAGRTPSDPEGLRLNSAVSSRFSTVSETAVLIRSDQEQQHEQADAQQLDKVYARISMRLMPLFLAVMILNHVDRTNLAYACESHRPAAAAAAAAAAAEHACAARQLNQGSPAWLSTQSSVSACSAACQHCTPQQGKVAAADITCPLAAP